MINHEHSTRAVFYLPRRNDSPVTECLYLRELESEQVRQTPFAAPAYLRPHGLEMNLNDGDLSSTSWSSLRVAQHLNEAAFVASSPHSVI